MKIIAIVAAAALLCGTTFSQTPPPTGIPAPDGATYTDGMGNYATIDVVDVNPAQPGCTVQVTDDSGFTPATTGTAGANSTTDKPTCASAPEATTTGGNTFRVKAIGKLEKKGADGKWRTWRKAKKPKQGQQRFEPTPVVGPGEEGTSLPGGPQTL